MTDLLGDQTQGRVLGHRRDPIYERHAQDWYREDANCVRKLFDAVKFDGAIHDPACGGGNIPVVASSMGYVVSGSDLVYRGFGSGGVDFFDDMTPRVNIVSNPPYVWAEKFVLHGLEVASGRVAVLVRLAFLEGQKRRRRLFVPHPPERVLVFATRPSMPPGDLDIEAKGGKVAYAWITWLRGHNERPIIDWLP